MYISEPIKQSEPADLCDRDGLKSVFPVVKVWQHGKDRTNISMTSLQGFLCEVDPIVVWKSGDENGDDDCVSLFPCALEPNVQALPWVLKQRFQTSRLDLLIELDRVHATNQLLHVVPGRRDVLAGPGHEGSDQVPILFEDLSLSSHPRALWDRLFGCWGSGVPKSIQLCSWNSVRGGSNDDLEWMLDNVSRFV